MRQLDVYLSVGRACDWLDGCCWLQACYKTCLQYFIIMTCGCGDSLYPLNATAYGGAQQACDITNSTAGKSTLKGNSHRQFTTLSCLCRVCFGGVNWIPDNSSVVLFNAVLRGSLLVV